jgi:hypothetical protein
MKLKKKFKIKKITIKKIIREKQITIKIKDQSWYKNHVCLAMRYRLIIKKTHKNN